MIVPRRALVRPRALAPSTGASLPLDELLAPFLEGGRGGSIQVVGAAGMGKTTALEHLAAVYSHRSDLWLVDERPDREEIGSPPEACRWVIRTLSFPRPTLGSAVILHLAPWREDEWIEYLLAAHKASCGSVIARLRREERPVDGTPELCRIVLDQLAADEALTNARAALWREAQRRFPDDEARALAATVGRATLLEPNAVQDQVNAVCAYAASGEAMRLLRHRAVQLLVTADALAAELETHQRCDLFSSRLSRDLVEELAALAFERPLTQAALQQVVRAPESVFHAMAASVLHAAGGWRPPEGTIPVLAGGYLAGVSWAGLNLDDMDFRGADLSGADLRGASLERAAAGQADLSHADLASARMRGLVAVQTNLQDADLTDVWADRAFFDGANLKEAKLSKARLREAALARADLRGACLAHADLYRANLRGADVAGADFTNAGLEHANLSGLDLRTTCCHGARFKEAKLSGCNLEDLSLPGADFTAARLDSALLTGTSMPGARFEDADLRGAGLADIDWEGAVLCHADLRGASFHLGSTRGGLVGSPIACEGSRTGFYTDEYGEQDFKAPEEIRKANLSHADLRGANIEGVDFYLVDLRHALLDPMQEEQVRRSGAIRDARVE